jgi:hypothetical protein
VTSRLPPAQLLIDLFPLLALAKTLSDPSSALYVLSKALEFPELLLGDKSLEIAFAAWVPTFRVAGVLMLKADVERTLELKVSRPHHRHGDYREQRTSAMWRSMTPCGQVRLKSLGSCAHQP